MIMRVNYAPLTEIAGHVTTFLRLGAGAGAAAGVAVLAAGDSRSRVSTDVTTNSLIVEAAAADLAKVKALVQRLDVQTPQVRIRSRLIAVNRNSSNGFSISWAGPLNLDQGRGLGFGGLTFPNFMRSNYTIDPGGIRAGDANFRFNFGSINNSIGLDTRIALAESRGDAELLQSSDVIVQDGRDATVSNGKTDVILLAGNDGGPGTAVNVDYRYTLNVTPRITADGFIRTRINLTSNNATPPASASATAGQSNRSIVTELLKRSGDTAVIGTYAESSATKNVQAIPWLSKLPIIGALFRSTINTEAQTDVLMLITPSIVADATSSPDSGYGASSGGGNSLPNQEQYQQQAQGQQQQQQNQANF